LRYFYHAEAAVIIAISCLPRDGFHFICDRLSSDGNAEFLSEGSFDYGRFYSIITLLRIAGVSLITGGLALLCFTNFLAKRSVEVLQFVREAFVAILSDWVKALAAQSRMENIALATVFLTGFILRFGYLFGPVEYDEAYTFTHYASKQLYITITDYSFPNNHLFHTFLVFCTTRLFGDALWAIRLPAFTAGILLLPIVYFFIRSCYGRYVALIGTSITAVSTQLIFYSVHARGYSILTLFSVLILGAVPRLRGRWAAGVWGMCTIFAALGFFTIPTMLYPYALFILLALLATPTKASGMRNRHILHLCVHCLATGIITFILYIPAIIVSGIDKLIHNKFVAPIDPRNLPGMLSGSLLETWHEWTAFMPMGAPVVLLVCSVLALIAHRRIAPGKIPHIAVAVILFIPMLAVQRVVPYSRVWIFLIPLFLAIASAGVIYMVRFIAAKQENVLRSAAVSISVIFLATAVPWLIAKKALYYTNDNADILPICTTLRNTLQKGDAVVTTQYFSAPTIFYLDKFEIAPQFRSADSATLQLYIISRNDTTETCESILTKLGIPRTWFSEEKIVSQYRFSTLYKLSKAGNPLKYAH
jgi:hypothetical protein